MTRVLIVGGYGGFGGRLSRRLAAEGYDVLVGGRSLSRARVFCADTSGCRPVQIDRDSDISAILAAERPTILVDAAGPFQRSGHQLVEACIAARINYLDLADAREFVTRIAQFDGKAKTAGATMFSGASSVPALSHAVVKQLAAQFDYVAAIEIAISASSRASAGASVATAILAGVGQPIRLWAGRRWQTAYGWQSLRRESFSVPGRQSLRRRLVALTDVPDLELLPERYPEVSAVSFRAGTESALGNLALWAASWLIRWGWFNSLLRASRPLIAAHRLTALLGGDRSGMTVRVFGTSGRQRLEARWTLIAEHGDGPEIPTLAAALLVGKIARGELAVGARDAGGALTLSEFEPAFANLAVCHAAMNIAHPPPLYARVMGDSFESLAPALRAIHGVLRDGGAHGQASVVRGASPLARLIAKAMRFPPAGEHRLHVHFRERNGAETWTRDFGGSRFSSRLSAEGDELVERFGLLRFHFALPVADGGLTMAMRRWSIARIPLPLALAPRSAAREWQAGGRFHFDVPIDLPLIGRVIHYRGWLDPGPIATI